ncbi:hypothetical protein LPB140_07490 [Sphingorhabdus lutea]|uniref:CheR-type methyltransferase domain-containing protein n=1 Tax=Sphingorhabdus lutea TaxID=1913578 RepID=A0A1L3JC06_9SPHN|nr:CheR family methyltransferase [Sphingorhabdus lutea]APG62656.1 hypothetical protein LPB140_07490 [Sphingorhabdus lutea]
MNMISNHDATFLSNMLEQNSGQAISPSRQWRFEATLKPILRENSIPDIATLVKLLASNSSQNLKNQCVEAMINNESSFFRDQPNFALLTGPVLDNVREQNIDSKHIRIWSAACSHGQEPYSIAMSILQNQEKWRGWTVEILATDISMSALQKAKTGQYSQFEVQRGLPVGLMIKYFTQNGDQWTISEHVRNMVHFEKQNLLEKSLSIGKFDIILCRNILMYFNSDNKHKVLSNISYNLKPDGFVMLGSAETVIGQSDELVSSNCFRGFYCINR